MYYYYQTGERTQWKIIADKKDLQTQLAARRAKKCTILALSEPVDEATDTDEIRYKGPLYFDIDCKDDIDTAAASARELVDRLIEYGVDWRAIRVYASGGKGFHILVEQGVFCTARPVKRLAKIYALMARDLYVPGLDYNVYAGGKGNTFRLVNVERHDGRYPVLLSLDELRTIDAAAYVDFVSAPRSFAGHQAVDWAKAPGLEVLFDRHKKSIYNPPPRPPKAVESKVLAAFSQQPPACIEAIGAGQIKTGANFNAVALQFGIFVARAAAPATVWQPLANRAAAATTSHTYDSPTKRRDHLAGQVHYAAHHETMLFSCYAMRAVVGNSVCPGCPLYDEPGGDTTDPGLAFNIEQRADGYYLLGGENGRKISNFTLSPTNECIEYEQQGDRRRRIGTQMDVCRDGDIVTNLMFSERAWASKGNFVAEVEGLQNLSFVGSDADVQRIKTMVYSDTSEVGEIVRVFAAGIHAHKILSHTVYVYVEPGFSVNSLKIVGTHELCGKVQAAPRLTDVRLPENAAELARTDAALSNLLEVNDPAIVAQVVGWFCACHLRIHFQRTWGQFPILSLWGASGSGKTSLARLTARLSGVDYMLENSEMNLASVNVWPLIDYLSTTTTVPRLLDEYNKSKMTQNYYNKITEIIKSTWNAETIGRGAVGRGGNGASRTNAHTVAIPMTAPAVVLGEQAPNVPAIAQRSIQVMLSASSRDGRTEYYENAAEAASDLYPLAKAMALSALQVKPEWLRERMKNYRTVTPKTLLERPRYSYRATLIGLDFLADTVERLGLRAATAAKVESLKTALIDNLKSSGQIIQREKAWSEVDAILQTVGSMCAITSSGANNLIILGKHVLATQDSLYIDVPVVYELYKRYAGPGNVVVEQQGVFSQLLMQEAYFVTREATMKMMTPNRPVFQLDLKGMEQKGHTISLFEN